MKPPRKMNTPEKKWYTNADVTPGVTRDANGFESVTLPTSHYKR
jgi:hypothetical protein